MRQYSGKWRTEVAERITTFLREAHPHKTAEHVAAATGEAVSTVEKWLERGSAPSGPALLRLLRAYRWPLISALYDGDVSWLAEQAHAERVEREAEQKMMGEARAEYRALIARIEACETALRVQDPDFHGPSLDALGEVARGAHRALDSKLKAEN